ncbi:MAG: tRNA threonylcarbamoyladenosine dehydratase [Saccharofermentans sp.]|jgi:tRNA A37 threonylcarbamoyladenosine dehydratase|nr:tRNA threonylcarbamoyladenosine dehydratase [Mageeibacillus sp.]MCI1264196.1 tRNA threonylcarbamoyladenosine dehydratase [Saccharofermentans sp.]MCI1274615.1 tRNA threonylcarbamoyladenosine dehydratase [Saccharofermentans sp.]MCI1768688.1 tRNA threonylcarbamoyladenosine dehydratase [Mageeibacillus sp.]
MNEIFARTELLLGADAMARLRESSVLIFGIGGVGGHLTEALARSGVGRLCLVDSDRIQESNINRQAVAFLSTIGKYKTHVMRDIIADINPVARVETREVFYLPESSPDFDFCGYDYIIDCIDTVSAKLDIIERAVSCGTPVISAMGAGNKLDPSLFRVSDISKTSYCPLAKVMRHELRSRGINHVNVCWSPEIAKTCGRPPEFHCREARPAPGSAAFVPSVCGLVMAGYVVRDLAGCQT